MMMLLVSSIRFMILHENQTPSLENMEDLIEPGRRGINEL